MSLEMPVIENRIEDFEFSVEQKKLLAQAWCDLIIDGEYPPENIGELSIPQIKQYLFDSLMRDVDKLCDEYGFRVDLELSEKIKNSKDVNEKSAFELEYVKQIYSQVDAVVQTFTNSLEKSTKWDSWPRLMRETKEFNCVGATLIGINLLSKGGIESYIGNPHGHVLNIVKLSNGECWYVDFRNGSHNIIKLDPERIFISGAPMLRINDPNIDYKIIWLRENSEVPSSILGNLGCLYDEASADDFVKVEENVEQKEARDYLKRYRQYFDKNDFGALTYLLYPNRKLIDDSEEMKKEVVRIEISKDFMGEVKNYTKTLNKAQESMVLSEMRANIGSVERFFYEGEDLILSLVGPESNTILNLFAKALQKMKQRFPELYKEEVDKIISRIKNYKESS